MEPVSPLSYNELAQRNLAVLGRIADALEKIAGGFQSVADNPGAGDGCACSCTLPPKPEPEPAQPGPDLLNKVAESFLQGVVSTLGPHVFKAGK